MLNLDSRLLTVLHQKSQSQSETTFSTLNRTSLPGIFIQFTPMYQVCLRTLEIYTNSDWVLATLLLTSMKSSDQLKRILLRAK
jgi:hypothetical protein